MIHKLKGVLFFVLLSCFSYAQVNKSAAPDSSASVVPVSKINSTPTDSSASSGAPVKKIKSSKGVDSSISVTAPAIKTNSPSASDSSLSSVGSSPKPTNPADTVKPSAEFIPTPTVGFGTGMFSFYGDLYNKHFQAPMVSRIAYDLSVSQGLTDYLKLNFYVLFGKLGAEERNAGPNGSRNLNFESQIRAGGLNLEYNFDNFLPAKRTASPFISLGIESFEFLSKTDMYDKYGNKYFYWTDGSIRNIDQSAGDAANAVVIHRDYTYESDIRETNLDGFGKYPERSWAIPVGIGAIFKLNNFWDFKIGTTMHFTFTDYIDGVTAKSVGNRVGNSQNDKFMMTSCSVHYNFGTNKKKAKKKDKARHNEENYKDVDFMALETGDEDKDGVLDFDDQCPGTPSGVPVDAKGCPLDDDEDGVPNYKDDEKNSPKGAFVNSKGVQMNDSLIAYQANFYNDSTGEYAAVETRDPEVKREKQREYSVDLGTYKKGLPQNLMTKFLSISDISSTNTSDSATIYTAGKFSDYQDAEDRRQQLIKAGLTDAKVVYKQYGKYHEAHRNDDNTGNAVVAANRDVKKNDGALIADKNPKNADMNTNKNVDKSADKKAIRDANKNAIRDANKNSVNAASNKNVLNNTINIEGTVLRVQLGAYKKRLSKSVFKNVNDLIEIKTEDGLYKYMTGSFTSFDAAAKHKTDMLLNGYPGAFIAAYKNGKRITLEEAGATFAKKEDAVETKENIAENTVNKKLVKFKVQLGVFKNQPPDDKLAVFSKLKDLNGEKTKSGLTRYVVGSFNDYKDAVEYKNDIKQMYNLGDVFVVALFNNEYISIQEALELLK